jgi:hypothetical protein
MRNFLLGVAVGAVGMGFYTGAIKIDLDERLKQDATRAKEKAETAASTLAPDQTTGTETL